jgi:hypothetical protein
MARVAAYAPERIAAIAPICGGGEWLYLLGLMINDYSHGAVCDIPAELSQNQNSHCIVSQST